LLADDLKDRPAGVEGGSEICVGEACQESQVLGKEGAIEAELVSERLSLLGRGQALGEEAGRGIARAEAKREESDRDRGPGRQGGR
jgi:hypothetical protein